MNHSDSHLKNHGGNNTPHSGLHAFQQLTYDEIVPKSGVKNRQDVQQAKAAHEQKKAPAKSAPKSNVGFQPSYDLEKIKDDLRKNTDIF